MYDVRLSRLGRLLREAGVGGLIVIPGPNLFYLTGQSFHLMERPVVALFPVDGEPAMVLPAFELIKGEAVPYPIRLFSYDESEASRAPAFEAAARHVGLGKMAFGIEPLRLRFLELGLLRQASEATPFVAADRVLAGLRQVKDDQEVGAIRKAVRAAEKGLEETLPLIRTGMTERELAAELAVQMLRAGSDTELPFPPIVASGPNSALPHAVPTDREFQAGDFLVLDWGATVEGYISDLTRTFYLPPLDTELGDIHRLVLQANESGRAAVRPGAAAGAIDTAAREVIEAGGYGAAFRHRTGHGIGLEAHEPPYIRSQEPQPLEPGMTFTVEPGIYLAGRGGVRIEDDILVTASGGESLSGAPRDLRPVG
jgi:Xaa-Pro dipeptidase